MVQGRWMFEPSLLLLSATKQGMVDFWQTGEKCEQQFRAVVLNSKILNHDPNGFKICAPYS